MTEIFLYLANMSITAGYLILAVLALRLILRKVPKNLLLWLWGLVGLRLALPISVESALSLIPKAKPIPMDIAYSYAPATDSGVAVIDRTVNPVMAENLTPTVTASVNPMQIVLTIAAVVWLVGVAAMLLYAAVSYYHLSKKVSISLHLRGNLYLCDGIQTPFILGIVKPKIYLPSDMDQENQSYVLRHERARLRHHDHLWKPLGFLLLSVYWYNPLAWVAYLLFCRDLEMACDERAVAGMGEGERKAYSYALLSCVAHRPIMAVCPVAFGENSVKSSIRNVLHFKKPGFWVIAAVIVITAIAAVCFLTNPKEEPAEEPALQTEAAMPTETVLSEEPYQPLDGSYHYRNGKFQLQFTHVVGVKTQTVQDENGQTYEQTILLTEPGLLKEVIDAARDGSEKMWKFGELTGTLGDFGIRGNGGRFVLDRNEYYVQDPDSRKVLLLKRKVEGIRFYAPATAKGALAYDRATGKLLYTHQHFMKVAPGNLGKLALALVIMENHAPEELVNTNLPARTITGSDGLTQPLYGSDEFGNQGDVTVRNLLEAMLLSDLDYPAYALALFDAGSEEAMVAKMNEYVKFACMDTHYTDLYGYADGQHTTAMDTLFLVNRMLENPTLTEIWSQIQHTVPADTDREYYTRNYMLDNHVIPEFYDLRVTGGFANYQETGNMVCTAKQDGKELLFVLLGAERKFADNGWQVLYFGNYDEMGSLIDTIFEAMRSEPAQFAD